LIKELKPAKKSEGLAVWDDIKSREINLELYPKLRSRLLDKNWQQTSPDKYLRLKLAVEEFEDKWHAENSLTARKPAQSVVNNAQKPEVYQAPILQGAHLNATVEHAQETGLRNLSDFNQILPGEKIKFGQLVLSRQDDHFLFTNAAGGEEFQLQVQEQTVNNTSADHFIVLIDNQEPKDLATVISVKQAIYRNLADQTSALAQQLQAEIKKNQSYLI
jgi:hypothetical protein